LLKCKSKVDFVTLHDELTEMNLPYTWYTWWHSGSSVYSCKVSTGNCGTIICTHHEKLPCMVNYCDIYRHVHVFFPTVLSLTACVLFAVTFYWTFIITPPPLSTVTAVTVLTRCRHFLAHLLAKQATKYHETFTHLDITNFRSCRNTLLCS
jgi:hypothetical protein